jgi:NitT/TauT family transport system substrate-binding protein
MKSTFRLFCAIALIAGSVGTASADDTLKVRTDWLPWGIHAGLHLAAQKGWYKDAGVAVEISDGKGSSLTMQQVVTGDVDVGLVQLGTMAIAHSQGLPVISIAGLARKGDLGAIVPNDESIKTVKDLEGKKVAYAASSAWGPRTPY